MGEQKNAGNTLFEVGLPTMLEAYATRANPWWQDQPMRPLPPFRRWLFEPALQRLKNGLAAVTVLRGPRQVGKTTLQEQIIDHLIHQEGVDPRRIFRLQFDELPAFRTEKMPILHLCYWFESHILKGSFNAWARKNEPVFLFFDEVQNLSDWAP